MSYLNSCEALIKRLQYHYRRVKRLEMRLEMKQKQTPTSDQAWQLAEYQNNNELPLLSEGA